MISHFPQDISFKKDYRKVVPISNYDEALLFSSHGNIHEYYEIYKWYDESIIKHYVIVYTYYILALMSGAMI